MSVAVITNSIIGDGCILDVICKTLFQILETLAAVVNQKLEEFRHLLVCAEMCHQRIGGWNENKNR